MMLKDICTNNCAAFEVPTESLEDVPMENSPLSTITKYVQSGYTLPLVGALLNHSCAFNTRVSPQKNLVTEWVADREIAAGEELTVSYVDSSLPVAERRSILKHGWGFDCNCPKCLKELNPHQ
jgi:SET domain-containing protein